MMTKHLPEGTSKILDLGCGNGIFPAFLYHGGYEGEYLGIDFSEGSINQAILGNATINNTKAQFIAGHIGDAWSVAKERGYEPDLVVCAETLEHLKDDEDEWLIRGIPSDMPVLVTVPRFNAPGHVRHFPQRDDVILRYGFYFKHLKLSMIKAPWRHWRKWCHLFTGVKK
jgi:SAM-dependent methyltransferase